MPVRRRLRSVQRLAMPNWHLRREAYATTAPSDARFRSHVAPRPFGLLALAICVHGRLVLYERAIDNAAWGPLELCAGPARGVPGRMRHIVLCARPPHPNRRMICTGILRSTSQAHAASDAVRTTIYGDLTSTRTCTVTSSHEMRNVSAVLAYH